MTIKDVALMAGVSQSAVSRYLNGGSLSEEKRRRIQATIEETGYQPTVAARMMRTGRQPQVGVLVPRIHSDSVAQIVEGINHEIQALGYVTVIAVTRYDEESELSYLSMMEKSGASGVIVMGTEVSPRRIEAYKASAVPIVITGQNIPGLPCVYHDDFHAVEELTKLMLKARGVPLAYIGADEHDPQTGIARREGMLSAYREAGFDEADLYSTVSTDFTANSGYKAMRSLLEDHGQVFRGVVCATDIIAIGAMRALYEAGLMPGKDIGITGIGDSWMGMYAMTPLTTARYQFRRCGEEAARMLLEQIDTGNADEEKTARHLRLNYEIIERGSV